MSTLLDLPAVVLDRIAQGLTSKEILRLHLLVCKSLSLDEGFWSRALMDRLRKLRPASLYYDGPDNCSNDRLKGLTGRDRFPDHAEVCDGRLAEALQAAGVSGVTWTGEWQTLKVSYTSLSFHTAAHVVLPPDLASLVANRSITHEDYARFTHAFECEHCGEDAQRQCAGCGQLLCIACCVSCSDDMPRLDTKGPYTGGPSHATRVYTVTLLTFCPFVLCQACDDSYSFGGEHGYRDDVFNMEEPGFSPHLCMRCPPDEALCPTHINCCILECSRCEDRACIDHCRDDPVLSCCRACNWMLCTDIYCHRADRRLLHCIELDTDRGCLSCYCSDCCPSEKCPECGMKMME